MLSVWGAATIGLSMASMVVLRGCNPDRHEPLARFAISAVWGLGCELRKFGRVMRPVY